GVDVEGLAGRIPAEVVQLWYQMAIGGRRDLPLAPSPRAGFEMSLLRMLAFRPASAGDVAAPETPVARPRPRAEAEPEPEPDPAGRGGAAASQSTDTAEPDAGDGGGGDDDVPWREPDFPAEDAVPPPTPFPEDATPRAHPPASPAPVPSPAQAPDPASAEQADSRPGSPDPEPAGPDRAGQSDGPARLASADDWYQWVLRSELKGPARVLAEHAGFLGLSGGTLRLALAPEDELLCKPALVGRIASVLAPLLGGEPRIS